MKLADPPTAFLKDAAWAILMLNLIVALFSLFAWSHVGVAPAIRLFVVFGAVVTFSTGGVALLNVMFVWMYERWEQRRGSRRTR